MSSGPAARAANRGPRRVELHPLRVDDPTFLRIPESSDGRMLPAVTAESEPFWTGFAAGRLVIMRCQTCGRFMHYPVDGCSNCGGAELLATEVEGRGTVYTFTVCYLEFGTGLEVPYVVAHVELAAQEGLRMISNIVNCRISDVFVGMPVRMIVVEGEQPLPFFEPETATGSQGGQ